eukprot:GFYU01019715.1.p1 GENE.GFYU01019715.1~~GFYU01019715.1.p1  ORF type:complete len:111 (+),score=38.71 GFYU01019715.1:26-334(+)
MPDPEDRAPVDVDDLARIEPEGVKKFKWKSEGTLYEMSLINLVKWVQGKLDEGKKPVCPVTLKPFSDEQMARLVHAVSLTGNVSLCERGPDHVKRRAVSPTA